MNLDAQVRVYLEMVARSERPRTSEGTVEDARIATSLFTQMLGPGPDLYSRRDIAIPVSDTSLRARIYDCQPEPKGVLVWFHSGGWVVGDIDDFDALCAALAVQGKCRVVSVNYRLAPENPYPAAVNDCFEATQWISRNLLGRDGVLMVGGDSAGGNLAAVTARRCRDHASLVLRRQILVYPVVDYDFGRPTYLRYGDVFPLGSSDMRWFWDRYVPLTEQRSQPDASPIRAQTFEGLPPAHIVIAEHDVLAGEAAAYAVRLESAGVPVTVDVWPGTIHGFFKMVGYFDVADAAIARVGRAIESAVATVGVSRDQILT